MNQPTIEPVGPILESPIAAAPDADSVLSPLQWETLLAITDTVIPSIAPSISADLSRQKAIDQPQYDNIASSLRASISDNDSNAGDIVSSYLTESATSVPGFKESLCRTLGTYVHAEGRRGISLVLNALNNRALSLILTGYAAPFQSHPYHVRETIYRGWQTSRLAPMKTIHNAIMNLSQKTWATLSPTLPKVLGFPRVPVHGTPADGFPFSFLQFPPSDCTETIEADVVIVGSGCGAGVTAKNLAEAGYRVIVVEKSYFFKQAHFPMVAKEGTVHLFENGGAELSDDGSIAVLSGSAWGGGGTVNWSASLQTQSFVRQEWADAGLPFFTSNAFQESLDRVCNRMGVSADQIDHNYSNKTLLDGARKLGFAAKAVPQNTNHHKHDCGYCTFGCASGGKQGPTVSTLVDAANAGATFIEGFKAEKILFERETVDGKRIASGVQGTWRSRDIHQTPAGEPMVQRKIVIKARKVVAACGTLQTPLLLLRSGLRNPEIGRNLYLHPVILTSAVFDDDIKPWEGSILTSVVNEWENLDGKGHGTKIETPVMLPSFVLPLFRGADGLDYKLFATQLRNMVALISLTRDKYPGRVYPDPVDGRCRIDYTPSAFDRKHTLEGIIGGAKIAYISGAKEIRTASSTIPVFTRPKNATPEEGINNPEFQAWIKKVRQGPPVPPAQSAFASAHQMGSCRMGTSAKTSVVDPTGMVWGTKGLYVMDASVFPSASGVNPMITNMAISDWNSRKLSETMMREQNVGRPRL